MKTSKKILSVLLALTLVLALSVCAFAADTSYTITINNKASGHTYEAYQIFTGDLSSTGVLSNIKWGTGVDSAALLTALKADTTTGLNFSKCASAADVAKVLSDANLDADAVAAQAFAQIVGQYLTTASASASTQTNNQYVISGLAAGYYLVKDKDNTMSGNENYTRFMLQVTSNQTVKPKNGTVVVEKKVIDTNDSTGDTSSWQDSADHDVGDIISFQLKGTLPANYADYTTYKYIFHDTESAGLTFDPDSVVVKADGNTITNTAEKTYYTVTSPATDKDTFDVSFADLKTISGLTASSVITVEYKATLNANAVLGSTGNPNEVTLEFSNNSNQGGEGSTGKTTKDTVIVFTYKTVVNKVDSNSKPLTGAAFTLEKYYKSTDTWTAIKTVEAAPTTTFTFSGLDDGIYRLTETTTPAGYNSIDPIYFTVTASHDVTSDNPTLTSLSATQTADDGSSLATGAVATFTADLTAGSLSTDIVNNSGSTLPSTGGIGTTIFTVAGVVLMIGAAVVLITKRKVSGEEHK
jgi:fimbrial isopeptide formation D2 family protein/LPXTG-motif cell wall-anchored protein